MNIIEITSSTPTELPQATRRRLSELFTREEIAQLTARSDWRGASAIVSTWAIIASAFAMLAIWPNVLTFVLALCIIAGRQLALAILEHEGAHGTLFRTRWLNDVVTDWFCARPIWQNLRKYRVHHLGHHTYTGMPNDPDLSLHARFPTTPASLRRKFIRDLSGYTGLKIMFGLLLMDAEVIQWTVANDIKRLPANDRRWYNYTATALRNMVSMLIANGVLFGILALCGHPMLYLVWGLAYLTPFQFFIRIRSIAEHGCLENTPDMFRNTRTTHAGLIARMFVAPMRVNYHIEHHLMASVPYYRLPLMHRLLRQKNAVPDAPSYLDVMKIASTPISA